MPDNKNLTLVGNRETCPRCRGIANVLDGTFDVNAQGIATLISGPAFTQDVYKQFVDLVNRAKDGNINKEEFVKEAQTISPTLAKAIGKFLPNDSASFIALLTFLWGIFAHYSGQKNEDSVTTIINNYDQSIHIEQPYISNYNRNYNVPGFRPTNQKVSKIIVKNADENTLVNGRKKKKNNSKPTLEKPISEESIKIDTSSYESTKKTIKRLLKKRK